jgi:hypothetical protein
MTMQKKNVARVVLSTKPISQTDSAREFLRLVPGLGFLFPKFKLHNKRRLNAVKGMFSKILGAIMPATASADPDTIEALLKKQC